MLKICLLFITWIQIWEKKQFFIISWLLNWNPKKREYLFKYIRDSMIHVLQTKFSPSGSTPPEKIIWYLKFPIITNRYISSFFRSSSKDSKTSGDKERNRSIEFEEKWGMMKHMIWLTLCSKRRKSFNAFHPLFWRLSSNSHSRFSYPQIIKWCNSLSPNNY